MAGNTSMKLNIEKGAVVHGDDYAYAVNDGLQAIVDLGEKKGWSEQQVKSELILQFGVYRTILEQHKVVW
ncbi:hypothetical protein [Novipirellula caenicola]|uniref:Uncharacterized protein n=1 Tax=Novipirellula caenicola TaxID=1536901 RepID=A0ABP9VRQ7_9BACT